MPSIRVVIADDLTVFRDLIYELVNNEPDFEVIDVCDDGNQLYNSVIAKKPDIILTDFKMPGMNALEVLKKCKMNGYSIPSIIISSYTREDRFLILECLDYGAIDIIEKPNEYNFKLNFDTLQDQIQKKLRYIYNNFLIPKMQQLQSKKFNYIGIGASTGGTKAIKGIVEKLPKLKETTIFIALHMPARYTLAFAERLNKDSINEVKEAVHREGIKKGTVYIAPGGYNLKIKNNVINIEAPLQTEFAPNINVMFESLSEKCSDICGILLTGMGKDGAKGLKQIYNNGGLTIVQNESSSLVFGMPKAAMEMFIVNHILSLEEISQHLEIIVH